MLTTRLLLVCVIVVLFYYEHHLPVFLSSGLGLGLETPQDHFCAVLSW